MDNNDKIMTTICFCKRANKLILGFDLVKKSMQTGTAELIVVASDLSVKTLKEVKYLASQFETEVLSINSTLDELWYLLGKRAGVIAITDYNFSQKIIEQSENSL